MAMDWLFGPRIIERWEDTDQAIRVRPQVIDTDTVRELAAIAQAEVAGDPGAMSVEASYIRGGTGDHDPNVSVPEDELVSLSIADLAHLRIQVDAVDAHGRSTLPTATINLERRNTPYVRFASGDAAHDWRARRRIAQKLLDNGHPRLNGWRIVPALGVLPGLAAFISWIWALGTVDIPIALRAFGWALVVFLIGGTVGVVYLLARWTRIRRTIFGHRILEQTRAETKAARANRKRDTLIAVVTAVLAITGTLITAALLGAFGLKN